MDDEAETYKLWRIRKTVMQVNDFFKMESITLFANLRMLFLVVEKKYQNFYVVAVMS